MCCDICPKYEECEEKNQLKDECCRKCPEYNYCIGKEEESESDKDVDSGDNTE